MPDAICVYLINCSKLELEKIVDELRTENHSLQLEVDDTSDFLTSVSQQK